MSLKALLGKCEFNGCRENWQWILVMNKGAKRVEFKLCSRCAVKVTKFIKGLESVEDEQI